MSDKKVIAKPIGDRVLVKADPIEERTKGGMLLDPEVQMRPRQGTIVATGPGAPANGLTGESAPPPLYRIPMQTKEGDKVKYSKTVGAPINIDGEEYLIMRESDILVIL